MHPESSSPAPDTPEPEHLRPGPFAIPGRDFLLSAMLCGIFVMKVLLGPRWWGYLLGGVLLIQVLAPVTAWLTWRWTGRRPFFAEIGYIATTAVLFVALNIPVYIVLLRLSEDL